MKYTAHALERMTERGICKSTVLATVINGEKSTNEQGQAVYTLYDHVVIANEDEDSFLVVTTFFDQPKKFRYSKKKHRGNRGGKRPASSKRTHSYSLQDMLSKVTAENQHAETDWGDPVGNEVW